MRTHRWAGPWAGVLVCLLASAALGDDHIVQKLSRTYMGRTSPPQQAEVWMTADKVCVKDGAFITITRRDLKKRWTVNVRSKKYFEKSLAALAKSAAPEKKPFRIQEYGFDYEPVYDWRLDKDILTETVNGRKCRKFVARGDADYSEEVREMWLTEDVPISIERAYETLTKPNLDAQLLRVYEKTPALRKGFVMKSVVTMEQPIAPTMVWVTEVTKVEIAPPPDGIYDLPAGMQKVGTLEELYAR